MPADVWLMMLDTMQVEISYLFPTSPHPPSPSPQLNPLIPPYTSLHLNLLTPAPFRAGDMPADVWLMMLDTMRVERSYLAWEIAPVQLRFIGDLVKSTSAEHIFKVGAWMASTGAWMA